MLLYYREGGGGLCYHTIGRVGEVHCVTIVYGGWGRCIVLPYYTEGGGGALCYHTIGRVGGGGLCTIL